MAHRITLLALPRCLTSNLIGAMDLLHTSNLLAREHGLKKGPVFEWQVLSLDGRPVKASTGYRLAVDGDLRSAPTAKIVMVPAFGSPLYEELSRELESCGPILAWLKDQYKKGATLAATCTGSFLLAETGLLDGKAATTSWWLTPIFEKRYPKVLLEPGSMLTDSQRIICSGTGMSHLDLTLHIIEKYAGRELARLCAKFMVLDHARRSQAPYMILNHLRSENPIIAKAEKWMREHLKRRISIEEVASCAAVSPRTLMRHFKKATGDSPQLFLQKIRVEEAKALLESSLFSVDEIMARVGYNDGSAFRRLFKKYTSLSPREYRKQFGIRKKHE